MKDTDDDFLFQAEDGIRDYKVTGVQTCALPISPPATTPSTPREYLSSDATGTGQSAATSSWSRRRTTGSSSTSRPMSTTVSSPQACSVGGSRCTGLATEKVTVSSAKTPSGSSSPPFGS